MNSPKFFQKFNLALRWFLPPAEANEVYADYQEMQKQADQNGESFLAQEDKPWQLARSLRNPQEYRKWLWVFLPLAACLLLFGFNLFSRIYLNYGEMFNINFLLFLGSVALSLFWARQTTPPDKLSPRLLLLTLALMLLIIAENMFWQNLKTYSRWLIIYTQNILNGQDLICLAVILLAALALLLCRLRSRRWLAVFLLAITLLITITPYYVIIYTMDFSDALGLISIVNELEYLKNRQIITTLVGFMGAIRVLC